MINSPAYSPKPFPVSCNLFFLLHQRKMSHKETGTNFLSNLFACLVLLEVIINGVLQLPELFLLLHFFLLLVSSQTRFHIVFFVIIILLFLQRQEGEGGRAAEGGVRGRS